MSAHVDAMGEQPRVFGTFSNLEYNEEGGDLLGFELKIVPTRRGHQAALQVAAGEPSEIMTVDVQVDKNKIRFQIPHSYPLYGGATFEGQIDSGGITGQFKWATGVLGEKQRLVRGQGYWDRTGRR